MIRVLISFKLELWRPRFAVSSIRLVLVHDQIGTGPVHAVISINGDEDKKKKKRRSQGEARERTRKMRMRSTWMSDGDSIPCMQNLSGRLKKLINKLDHIAQKGRVCVLIHALIDTGRHISIWTKFHSMMKKNFRN